MYVSVYIEEICSLCSFYLIYNCVKKKMNNIYIFIYFNITSLKSITINMNNKYNKVIFKLY